jgi:hypothetical protein
VPEKESSSTGWADLAAEEKVLGDLLIPLAQARLELQLGDVGSVDSKAFGVLALDVGVIGLLLASHDAIHRLWPVVLVGYLTAAVLLIAASWPRTFQVGVVISEFYAEMSKASPIEAARQMLSELNACKDENDKPLAQKVDLFMWGLRVLLLSLAATLPIALVHP